MTIPESKIRDFLSENLELIERGLSLVQVEFQLNNEIGAGGKIDILAKDKFGLHTIIEVKRSNQSARHALHELHKYIALYQIEFGIKASDIRSIIVSTEWHEPMPLT